MNLSGHRHFAAPPRVVWDALDDPDLIRSCIAGCEELTGSLHDGFRARISRRIGLVPLRGKGRIRSREIRHLRSATFTIGHRKDRPEPLVTLVIELEPTGQGTELEYEVAVAALPGPLAVIGGSALRGFAERMSEDFFACFAHKVEARARPA